MHLMSQPLNPSLNYSNDVLTTEGRGLQKQRDFESCKANGQVVIIEPGEQNPKPVVRTVEKHSIVLHRIPKRCRPGESGLIEVV